MSEFTVFINNDPHGELSCDLDEETDLLIDSNGMHFSQPGCQTKKTVIWDELQSHELFIDDDDPEIMEVLELRCTFGTYSLEADDAKPIVHALTLKSTSNFPLFLTHDPWQRFSDGDAPVIVSISQAGMIFDQATNRITSAGSRKVKSNKQFSWAVVLSWNGNAMDPDMMETLDIGVEDPETKTNGFYTFECDDTSPILKAMQMYLQSYQPTKKGRAVCNKCDNNFLTFVFDSCPLCDKRSPHYNPHSKKRYSDERIAKRKCKLCREMFQPSKTGTSHCNQCLNANCEECAVKFFSNSGKARLCSECRPTKKKVKKKPKEKPKVKEREKPKKSKPKKSGDVKCRVCGNTFFSASGMSKDCPDCRENDANMSGTDAMNTLLLSGQRFDSDSD